jgi:hypothetical protein
VLYNFKPEQSVCAVNSIINIVVININIINGYTNLAASIPPTTDGGIGKARAINE